MGGYGYYNGQWTNLYDREGIQILIYDGRKKKN